MTISHCTTKLKKVELRLFFFWGGGGGGDCGGWISRSVLLSVRIQNIIDVTCNCYPAGVVKHETGEPRRPIKGLLASLKLMWVCSNGH